MKILGIDPGTGRVGWGVIESKKEKIKSQNFGIIETTPHAPIEERLEKIYQKISAIIDKEQPDIVAIEEIFFFKNQKTVISVSQSRGVIVLAAKTAGKKIYSYTPLQVKESVVGYGRAEKNQVQEMVKMILHLKEKPKPDDIADALAIAICCANSIKMQSILMENPKSEINYKS